MKQRTQQEDLIIRYFLGELSEQEQAQVEERFLADSQFFEEMLSVEDALIDAYAQGELSDAKRERVEKSLLSSHRQAHEVSFVRDLINDLARKRSTETNGEAVLAESPSRRRPLMILRQKGDSSRRLSFALPALLLAFSIPWAIWNLILQNKLAQVTARQIALQNSDDELRQHVDELNQNIAAERGKRNELEQEITVLQESQSAIQPGDIATISFSKDSFLRGSGRLETLQIRPSINRLKITIDISEEHDYENYSATIKTFDGRQVWSRNELRPARINPVRFVLILPAKLFADDHYTLTLKGQKKSGETADIGDYSFRIKTHT